MGTEEKPQKELVEQDVDDILCQQAKLKVAPCLLGRKCKLSGQIDVPGQTEEFTLVSLIHEIDPGIKVYATEFFCLLDQMLMLSSYQNRKRKIPCQFFLPAFETYTSVKFHFQLGTIPCKMGDWG